MPSMTLSKPGFNRVSLAYGNERVKVLLPGDAHILAPAPPSTAIEPSVLDTRLNGFFQAHHPDLNRPVLIVTDKTRRCSYPELLPVLTATINRWRGSDEPFPIIIAYGTHPRQSDAESYEIYGELYNAWPFVHHDCTDASLFRQLGRTSAGTPVRIRADLLDASTIITFGPICHHYFAGYGGGRKLVFPGCGERDAIYHNHGLYLDRTTRRLATGCRPGNLAANPVADDLFEVIDHISPPLAIHGVQNVDGAICDLVIGTDRRSYLEACSLHARIYELSTHGFDLVVASCGGYPKDINFIQAHKAIHNAAGFVRDGGSLVVFTQCSDGIGSDTFLPWFGCGGYDGAFAKLSESYSGNGGTALAMMNKTARITIYLVTELTIDICTTIGVTKISGEEALRMVRAHKGTIGCLPNAGLLVNSRTLEI
jgi:nickel-dependent lactate racemase